MTRASGEFAPLSNSRKWAVILILVGKPQQAPTGECVGDWSRTLGCRCTVYIKVSDMMGQRKHGNELI